jgi:carbamoyl-phosphate synthase small subunit
VAEPAILALEDGTVFKGISVGAPGQRTLGEVVFNTSMTGYQEILTDPSYYRQLVTLTYPHIGNVGINSDDFESQRIFAAGLIIRDLSRIVSNWRAEASLQEFLQRGKTVAIAEIDTRRLTRIIREKGALAGCILTGDDAQPEEAVRAARKFPGLKGADLAKLVTTKQPYQWNQGTIWPERPAVYSKRIAAFHVVAVDYGIKRNILRLLADLDCRLTVVPATTSVDEMLELNPDGVFLSNGPGDPEACTYAIEAVQSLLRIGIPMFGICLGHQLIGLATGAKTVKMKFGHHGANHPVVEIDSGRVLITSQNHGFAVDESTLPDNVRPTHRSLFDGSLQGIEIANAPAFSFQGHPEGSPGPHDLTPLFRRFAAMMKEHRRVAVAAAG